MPRRWMILSGINLNQDFAGYLTKLGKNFLGFINLMHKIGLSKILLTLLACTAVCNAAKCTSSDRGLLLCNSLSQISDFSFPPVCRHVNAYNIQDATEIGATDVVTDDPYYD